MNNKAAVIGEDIFLLQRWRENPQLWNGKPESMDIVSLEPRRARKTKRLAKNTRWSTREQEELYKGVQRHGLHDWAAVSAIDGLCRRRTNRDVRNKWQSLTRQGWVDELAVNVDQLGRILELLENINTHYEWVSEYFLNGTSAHMPFSALNALSKMAHYIHHQWTVMNTDNEVCVHVCTGVRCTLRKKTQHVQTLLKRVVTYNVESRPSCRRQPQQLCHASRYVSTWIAHQLHWPT